MKNFLFTADVHLKSWNDNIYTDEGISLKLSEILQCVTDMCEYAEENNIKDIIIGGDLNDTKGIVNVSSFVKFKEIIEKYKNLTFHIIPGNHDYAGRASQTFAVELLSGVSNINIYTEKTVLDYITLLPWSDQDLVSKVNDLKENRIFISHFGLDEAQLSSGISIRSGISANMLAKFEVSLLGHYHKPQELKVGDSRIIYSGSLIPLRRDEINENKRFLHVEVGDEIDIKYIPTKGYRNYYEFVLEEDTDIDEVLEKIEELKNENNYVLLKDNRKKIDSKTKNILDQVQYIHQYEEEFESRGITTNMELKEQLNKWCTIKNIPENEVDEYVEIGLKYALSEETIPNETLTEDKEVFDEEFFEF